MQRLDINSRIQNLRGGSLVCGFELEISCTQAMIGVSKVYGITFCNTLNPRVRPQCVAPDCCAWSQFLLKSTCPQWEPNSTEELQLTLGQLNEQLDELALASDKARPKI